MASSLENYFHDSVEDFNRMYNVDTLRSLRIFQWNVRGLNDMKKFDDILQYLDT